MGNAMPKATHVAIAIDRDIGTCDVNEMNVPYFDTAFWNFSGFLAIVAVLQQFALDFQTRVLGI